jgi:hypothetical protein
VHDKAGWVAEVVSAEGGVGGTLGAAVDATIYFFRRMGTRRLNHGALRAWSGSRVKLIGKSQTIWRVNLLRLELTLDRCPPSSEHCFEEGCL